MVFSENRRRIFLSIAEATFTDDDNSPPSHAYGLSTELNLDRSTVGRHLQALVEEGIIEENQSPEQRTEYVVTDSGSELIESVQNSAEIFLGETKRTILSHITESESTYGYSLADQLSLQRSNAYRHLSDLESDGLVRSFEDGRKKKYVLTNMGITIAGVLCS